MNRFNKTKYAHFPMQAMFYVGFYNFIVKWNSWIMLSYSILKVVKMYLQGV